ncbi:MAG: hypothetical protein Q8L52_02275, partial [bacterium]|nr:hypothetical protein [bacterium]
KLEPISPRAPINDHSRLADSALTARSQTRGRPRALAALLLSLIRGGGVARNVWSGRARGNGSSSQPNGSYGKK